MKHELQIHKTSTNVERYCGGSQVRIKHWIRVPVHRPAIGVSIAGPGGGSGDGVDGVRLSPLQVVFITE